MIRQLALVLAFAVCALGLSACGGRMGMPPLPVATDTTYTLDAGDKVQVTVFGEPRLTGAYVVTDSGQLSIPLLGHVPARGLTLTQLQGSLTAQLQARQLVATGGVSVQIEQFRPFFILGEVAHPGSYPYVEGMSVLTAAAIAGGFTFRADKNTVSITRKVDGKPVEFKASRDAEIAPGDVINVFESYL